MKRIIVILAIVVVAVAAYRYHVGRTGPLAQYKAFADEVLHRRYDAAAAMTDGLTAKDLEELGTQEHIGAGPPMFQTLFPSRFDIESEETDADGTVTIRAIQTVLFNPAGVESAARPAMYAEMKQSTRLRKGDDGWKVVAFENTFQKMDSYSAR